MEKKLRKYRNDLVVTGAGVILFGLWTVVKMNMVIFLFPDILESLPVVAGQVGIPVSWVRMLLYVIIAITVAVILGIRLYIGMNAIAEGKGRTRGYAYLILAGILLFSNIRALPDMFISIYQEDSSLADAVITVLVELTSLYNLSELLYNGLRIKQMKWKKEV